MSPTQILLVLAIASVPIGAAWAAARVVRRPVATGPVDTHEHLSPWTIVAALLLPIIGVVIAIVLLAQGRGSHGAAVLLTSVLGWFIAAALFL